MVEIGQLKGWFKEVNILTCTGPIFTMVSYEDLDILEMMVKICIHYKKVTPDSISKEFGIKANLVERLLNLLSDDFKILDKKHGEDGTYYEPKNDQYFNPGSKEKSVLKTSVTTRFSICPKPLIFIDKYLLTKTDTDSKDELEIFAILNKLNIIMKDPGCKNWCNIPSKYAGLDLSQGFKINGINVGRVTWDEDRFRFSVDQKFICTIDQNHPDFDPLSSEFAEIHSGRKMVSEKIDQVIQKMFPLAKFSFQLDDTTGLLEIIVKDDDLNHFGELYRVYKEINAKKRVIPLQNGWCIEASMKITFLTPKFTFLVAFLVDLQDILEKKNTDLICKDKRGFISEIEAIQKKHAGGDTSLRMSELEFKKFMKMMRETQRDDWLNIVYAKLVEDEVFV